MLCRHFNCVSGGCGGWGGWGGRDDHDYDDGDENEEHCLKNANSNSNFVNNVSHVYNKNVSFGIFINGFYRYAPIVI